jgi:hypothetical protein
MVSIFSRTPGATLYYSFDPLVEFATVVTACLVGRPCDPTPRLVPVAVTPAWVAYTDPIAISSNSVLKAKAEKPGYLPNFACAPYELPRLPRPEFIPAKGPIANGTFVAISSPVPSATIRYTLDGTEPAKESLAYSAPLRLNGPTRLKARAFQEGFNESFTKYTYYRSLPKLPSRCTNSWELPHLKLTGIAGADRPVWITHAGDGTRRLFFVEQPGAIRIVGKSAAFLDLRGPAQALPPCVFIDPLVPPASPARNVSAVSVAFPPDYDSKAYFYVSYFAPDGTLVVSRFTALANPDVADADSEQPLASFHDIGCHGGQLVFSLDGTLYLNVAGPIANAVLPGLERDLNALSGKMLPILNENGLPLTNEVAETFWPFDRYFPATNCSAVGGVFSHGSSCRMDGLYLYGDSSGAIRGLKPTGPNWEDHLLARPQITVDVSFSVIDRFFEQRPFRISAFGEDEEGRLYVANYGTTIATLIQDPYWHVVESIGGGGIYLIEDDLLVFSVRQQLESKKRLRLEWQSAPGMSYRVQVSTDLVHWKNFRGPVQGTGGILSMKNVPVEKGARRFYRVVATSGKNPPQSPED